MNRLELFQILQPIVKSVTGVSTVILANQVQSDGTGIPSPTGEYITIEPKQSVAQRGQANIHRNTSATPLSLDVDVRAQIIVEAYAFSALSEDDSDLVILNTNIDRKWIRLNVS